MQKKMHKKIGLVEKKRGPIMVANPKIVDATIIARLWNEIYFKPRRKILKIDWDPVSRVASKKT